MHVIVARCVAAPDSPTDWLKIATLHVSSADVLLIEHIGHIVWK